MTVPDLNAEAVLDPTICKPVSVGRVSFLRDRELAWKNQSSPDWLPILTLLNLHGSCEHIFLTWGDRFSRSFFTSELLWADPSQHLLSSLFLSQACRKSKKLRILWNEEQTTGLFRSWGPITALFRLESQQFRELASESISFITVVR